MDDGTDASPVPWYGHIVPPRDETLQILATWRFPDDLARRSVFLDEHSSGAITLDGSELAGLIVARQRRRDLNVVVAVEARCRELLDIPNEPRRRYAEAIIRLTRDAKWLL
ncbi:MAG TPA: hypothetical protein VGL09_20800, partial [Methylomirabilota bacterium]